MTLRRFQPISRAGQWSETVAWVDPRTRQANDLTRAILTLALYQRPAKGPFDYGRPWGGWGGWRGPWDDWGDPVLSAVTQAGGGGPFAILPGARQARFTFPSAMLGALCPGDAQLVIWATVNGVTDEIERETIRVLDGPVAMPVPVPVVAPPAPDPSVGITVIVDGGDR